MLLSDKINLALSITSTIVAVLSIIFVILTIRQNSKMIKSTTRPYVSIFILPGAVFEIVIKNFGASDATITKCVCNANFSNCKINPLAPFENTVGLHLCPGQFITYSVIGDVFVSDNSTLNITLEYASVNSTYIEDLKIELAPILAHTSTHHNVNEANAPLYTARALEDISKTLLKK